MVVCVQHWDAFTRQAGKGNPAGIVLAAEEFSDDDIQSIASSIGFNDTAFVLPSLTADFRIRYFAPRREVDLCGHATIVARLLRYTARACCLPTRWTASTRSKRSQVFYPYASACRTH